MEIVKAISSKWVMAIVTLVTNSPSAGLVVRPMTTDDLPAVLDIERRCYSHPWREKIFADCLRSGYLCRLALLDGVVVGYFVVMTVLDEATLLNLCVQSEVQGGGVGRQLLDCAVQLSERAGAVQMFLEVRASNKRAIQLYDRYGFVEHGVRRGYYPLTQQQREDALLLAMVF